jgi:hypothetical protein
MILFLSTILLVLAVIPATAQTELLPGRPPINEAVLRELAMGSIPKDSSLYSQPPDYYSQPLIFKRTSGKFKPDAMVRYHFSRVDSLPFSRLSEYDAEYLSLRAELVSLYGESTDGSPALLRLPTERGTYVWTRGDLWKRGGMTIEMYMHFPDSTLSRGAGRIVVEQKWE